jgi:hypothetical protein
MRGPAFIARPGKPRVPAHRTAGERFDALALGVMQELWERFPDELGDVQLGVEEVPLLPAGWSEDTVPLASFVPATARTPARLVLLRRPIEHRAQDRAELEALLLTVLVEQVAEVLGCAPEDVHPDYEAD